MEKAIGTMGVAAATDLTAAFSFAEFMAAGVGGFPVCPWGCPIAGGLIVVSLKRQSARMCAREASGAFGVFAVLMALVLAPGHPGVENAGPLSVDGATLLRVAVSSPGPFADARRGFL